MYGCLLNFHENECADAVDDECFDLDLEFSFPFLPLLTFPTMDSTFQRRWIPSLDPSEMKYFPLLVFNFQTTCREI